MILTWCFWGHINPAVYFPMVYNDLAPMREYAHCEVCKSSVVEAKVSPDIYEACVAAGKLNGHDGIVLILLEHNISYEYLDT